MLASIAAFSVAIQISAQEPPAWMAKSQQMLTAWSGDKVVVFNLTIQVEQVAWIAKDGKHEVLSARTPQGIMADVDALNRDFSPAGIGFRIKRVIDFTHEVPYNPLSTLAHKAIEIAETGHLVSKVLNHPILRSSMDDSVDIAYVFGMGAGTAGLAELKNHTGGQIWISGSTDMPQVLSHEMGHHFGLNHTFAEGGDDVDDTPQGPSSMLFLGGDKDPNGDNVMTYSNADGRKFSAGQIDKMRRHASAWLSDECSEGAGWSICNPDPNELLRTLQ